jgi:GNT-I family
MNYAPIAIFVYKRPGHTKRMLESLMQCPEFAASPIYVFSDAAKKTEDEERVSQTRFVVDALLKKKARIIEAEINQGLAKSIISGVTFLLTEYDRVIVLEDDLLLSPRFLSYMNAALVACNDEPSVMQVSGYMFPVKEFADQTEVVFLPFISSWGWATWRRAWQHFDPDAAGWEILKTDKVMRRRFNLDQSYEYFEMLNAQMSGIADSWAIRWYWSVFKRNGYVVYPPVSHVDNTGLDGSGTHGSFTGKKFNRITNVSLSNHEDFPENIHVSSEAFKLVQSSLRGGNSRLKFFMIRKIRQVLTLFRLGN